MEKSYSDQEYKFLIHFFRDNFFRKIIFSILGTILMVLLYKLFIYIVIGQSSMRGNINMTTMIIVSGIFFIRPVSREFKTYTYIKKKDYETINGICIKKDYDILPKSRGYEISYYVDVQDSITGFAFTRIKVPRYIYKKIYIGKHCKIIAANPNNNNLLYICPIFYYEK